MNHRQLAKEMRRAAVLAGAETLRWFGGDAFEASDQPAESPVIQADLAADRVIVTALGAAASEIPIITEERAEGYMGAAPSRFLLVDPLDGAEEFINARGEYTVNIALIEAGAPVLGVVYAPAMERLFWTPEPSFAVEEKGEINPTHPTETRQLWSAQADNAALRVVTPRGSRGADTDAYLTRYKIASAVIAASSLTFCRLAAGEADIYPWFGESMEWDVAAGHAVLRAAGGRIDWLSEEEQAAGPLIYGKAVYENPRFVAYSESVALL